MLYLSSWSRGHEELQLQRNTADRLLGMLVLHTEFLREAYRENHISEQFLVGRKDGVNYLPQYSLIFYCPLLVPHFTKREFPLFFQSTSPSPSVVMPRYGISSKPGSRGVSGTLTKRKRRTQPREPEKHLKFVSNVPLKDSKQESNVVGQCCGEQLKEG